MDIAGVAQEFAILRSQLGETLSSRTKSLEKLQNGDVSYQTELSQANTAVQQELKNLQKCNAQFQKFASRSLFSKGELIKGIARLSEEKREVAQTCTSLCLDAIRFLHNHDATITSLLQLQSSQTPAEMIYTEKLLCNALTEAEQKRVELENSIRILTKAENERMLINNKKAGSLAIMITQAHAAEIILMSVVAEIAEQARNQVEDARLFFVKEFGCTIGPDGLIIPSLTEEQLEKLKEWHDKANYVGIEMPTPQVFFQKILLGVSLWRQTDGERKIWLLGKGVGVEAALLGTIKNRRKKNIHFSYRTHSDFECYGVTYQSGSQPYSKEFKTVFGGQEYFSPTSTKGLQNLEPELLHTTAELVDLGGFPVWIPQLELLFLDKYIRREKTPRPEGYDAILLARQYHLDKERTLHYFDKYYIQPQIQSKENSLTSDVKAHAQSIKNDIDWITQDFREQRRNLNKEELVHELNKKSGNFYEETRIALNTTDIDETGNLQPEYVERLTQAHQQNITRMNAALIERKKELEQVLDES